MMKAAESELIIRFRGFCVKNRNEAAETGINPQLPDVLSCLMH